ncbi:platelet glycoprotein IX [Alosa pseudoharengus]|uniref:glycoprotein IX (platelet) n=1 Tax=Alosa sapidissima TaxID=34773 RepID=UPI001C07F8AC|nr:glycoprotein IX (platelet) [Alosa sapidissima]XP_041955475.1 glycoprotein IX (platelet) [Alosa sapidissima]
MLSGVGIVLLVLLELSSPRAVSSLCQCSALQTKQLKVNCSSQKLKKVPHVPANTEELHLQNNLLTGVPVGYFDTLQNLRMVYLSGNRFHCDCRIQYLHTWLLRNRALVQTMPICASPDAHANKAITELVDSDFSSCSPDHSCPGGLYDIILGFMLCALIVLLFWSIKLAKDSTYILGIYEKHAGFEAELLRSRKPKHRMRTQRVDGASSSAYMVDELEQPLFNMEILPQIVDALHKKHNIKIKVV